MNVRLVPLQGPRCHIHDKRGGAGEPGRGRGCAPGVRAGQLAVEVVTTPAVLTTGAAQWSEWLLSGSRQIREDEYDVAG